MKLLLFLGILSLNLNSIAQFDDETIVNCPFDADGKINYTNVLEYEGMSQKDIYNKMKDHIRITSASKDYPILISDTNKIIGKSIIQAYYNGEYRDVVYSYKLYFRAGKLKYELTDMVLTLVSNAKMQSGAFWTVDIIDEQIVKYPVEEKYKDKSYRKRKGGKMGVNLEKKYGFFEGIEIEVGKIVEGYKTAMLKKDW
ncbi:MAG: hypothetical protein JNJ41_19270 [Bacteroidia bacterium]|nr:hypothetical protein [Bacteroidia bacterium]